jgi:hypothetical protein
MSDSMTDAFPKGPRLLTTKRAAALMEFASWPETQTYRRKNVSMHALGHLGLVVSVASGGWLFTERGRRIANAMLDCGQRMLGDIDG